MKYYLIIMFLTLSTAKTLAVWSLPITNQYDRLNYNGVPGGIPIRTDIHATHSAGASAATINSSIVAGASNKVIKLNAGTYNISEIVFDNIDGITLRGSTNSAGYPTTIINSSGGIEFNALGFGFLGAAALSSGYTAGSTSVVFSATPNAEITSGNLMQIKADGIAGMHYDSDGSSATNLYTTHRVLTKSGTTVTFTPPLPMTYVSGQNPKALYMGSGPGSRMCGVEDIVLNVDNTVSDAINGWGMDSCWFKNIVISNISNSGIFIFGSVFIEVRHCFITHAKGTPNNTDGFGVYPHTGTTASLFVDNIGQKIFSFNYQTDGCGVNSFMFNFVTNCTAQGLTRQVPAFRSNHGPSPIMTLFEGNIGEGIQVEAYHGSDSHGIIFRNWWHGLSTTGTENRIMVNICRGGHWYVEVGNILGDDSWSGPGDFNLQMTGSPGYDEQAVIYRDGYPNTGNNSLTGDPVWPTFSGGYPDLKVASTLLRHANYNYKTASIVYSNGLDTVIPNSVVYLTKPSWFGICPWPPFNLEAPNTTNPTNIPAGWRFVNNMTDVPLAEEGGGDPAFSGGQIILRIGGGGGFR